MPAVESDHIQKELSGDVGQTDLNASQKSDSLQQTMSRPRSRPSDKHPIKRGNSSSSNQNKTEIAKVGLALDESADEDGEEEYEPQFDELDDDEEEAAEEDTSQQLLNRSKPSVPLDPVNEEVKEMKSVDEETNKDIDDDDYSDDNDAMGIELQDINDIKTPKDHEQNEQSFRGSEKEANLPKKQQPSPK